MQTADTSHVCLDDLTRSTQNLLVPELHILGPYIQCLVKIQYIYVKKIQAYRILQIEPLRPTVCIQPFTFKKKENNLFSFIKSLSFQNTRCFITFFVITNIYNKKTKGPTLMELFTATGKLKKFFLTTRDVRCVHHG